MVRIKEQSMVFRGIPGTLRVSGGMTPMVEWEGPTPKGGGHPHYMSCDRISDGSVIWYGPEVKRVSKVDLPQEFVGLALLLLPDKYGDP